MRPEVTAVGHTSTTDGGFRFYFLYFQHTVPKPQASSWRRLGASEVSHFYTAGVGGSN